MSDRALYLSWFAFAGLFLVLALIFVFDWVRGGGAVAIHPGAFALMNLCFAAITVHTGALLRGRERERLRQQVFDGVRKRGSLPQTYVEETLSGRAVRLFHADGTKPVALCAKTPGNRVRKVSEKEVTVIQRRWAAETAAEERERRLRREHGV